MSEFKVAAEKIIKVDKHPNADRLDLVTVLGWQCVAQKDSVKEGDTIIYIPIDCLLPIEVESALFGPESKIKLHKSRVRTIKIRGAISQGMIASPETLGLKANKLKIGEDLSEVLRISKYEPPKRSDSMFAGAAAGSRKTGMNPNFRKYGGIENFKNYPELFEEGEHVTVTEKIHGTHFRCGVVPSDANTVWQKIKKFFGMLPANQFVFGSNNVQLQSKLLGKTYYKSNVYAKIVKQYKIEEQMKEAGTYDLVLHGEIYGDGIQKNYNYGLEQGEHKLAIFDVRIFHNEEWHFVDFALARSFAEGLGLEFVPLLYSGPYTEEHARKLTKGASVLCPDQKVREGVVIKPAEETKTFMGRKLLKLLSDDYLLDKNNTDFH